MQTLALPTQVMRFGLVGALNTGVGLTAIYGLMYFAGIGPGWANAAGYAIGMLISFSLNRAWTFRDERPAGQSGIAFLAAAASCYGLNLALVTAGLAAWPESPYLMQALGVASYTTAMFFACRYLVFRTRPAVAAKAVSSRRLASMASACGWFLLLGVGPLVLALRLLDLFRWDLSVPLVYSGADDVWQLILTKALRESGWALTVPFLGAPEVASWHHNAAAQTSALHSILMLALAPFTQDAVQLQQLYYLLNFPLITFTSFLACRLLGIARLPAACIGFLFAFTTFRISELLYAFLANYFAVPLAMVSVVWVMTARFEKHIASTAGWREAVATMLRDRRYLLGLLFVAMVAGADGYYAFFTLLLLGFAVFMRAVSGDWRSPRLLLPGLVYAGALITVALCLQIPLALYKHRHPAEFAPGGVVDTSLAKHPSEAEVYSASLKMLISPIPDHRIAKWAELGRWMIGTSDDARKFRTGRAIVPLGTLGSVLLLAALTGLMSSAAFRRSKSSSDTTSDDTPGVLRALALFGLLCASAGGIGAVIALVYPTIRAYDRFGLFLQFTLFLYAGVLATQALGRLRLRRLRLLQAAIVLLTLAALWDQTPANPTRSAQTTRQAFLDERKFIRAIEAELPAGAMVYNHPYSQYLRENRYYGWGSFAHVRFAVHSNTLHWSNGGAKNSPADDWHLRLSQLPFPRLVSEMEAAGFRAMLLDRTVIPRPEYESARQFLAQRGYAVQEDASGRLAFVQLRDPGFRVSYDETYTRATALSVTDPSRVRADNLPHVMNAQPTLDWLRTAAGAARVARPAEQPALFRSSTQTLRSSGQIQVSPLSDMQGSLACALRRPGDDAAAKVEIRIDNRSAFDWNLNAGTWPLRIGAHVDGPQGATVAFDPGFRVAGTAHIPAGTSLAIDVPIAKLPDLPRYPQATSLSFALLQEGHAWFEHIHCSLPATELR